MQIFRSGKDVLPKHKPVIYICNVTPLILHLLSFVKVTADFIPKINRPLSEGFVVDINIIGNSLLCNLKYTEVWGNQIHKNIPIGNITALTVGHEFNRNYDAK